MLRAGLTYSRRRIVADMYRCSRVVVVIIVIVPLYHERGVIQVMSLCVQMLKVCLRVSANRATSTDAYVNM